MVKIRKCPFPMENEKTSTIPASGFPIVSRVSLCFASLCGAERERRRNEVVVASHRKKDSQRLDVEASRRNSCKE
jgi:hypothetical protein